MERTNSYGIYVYTKQRWKGWYICMCIEDDKVGTGLPMLCLIISIGYIFKPVLKFMTGDLNV